MNSLQRIELGQKFLCGFYDFRIIFRKKFRTKEDNQEVQVKNGIPHLIHHQATNTKTEVKKAIYLKNYTSQISDKNT